MPSFLALGRNMKNESPFSSTHYKSTPGCGSPAALPLLRRFARVAPCVFLTWNILWHVLFAGQVSMSYAFYPMDLLLPPVTGFRTAISMLLLLLAGVITLCYVRRAFRGAARVPDPQAHPIYDVGGPIAAPYFDYSAAVQTLEVCMAAGRASAAKALDSARSRIPDRILPDVVDGLFAGTERRCSLSLA